MKKIESKHDAGSMEGRIFSPEGKDLGDKKFHEEYMAMDPALERKRLEDLVEYEVRRREDLAASFETEAVKTSRELYKRLSDENPDHPHRKQWLDKLEALK